MLDCIKNLKKHPPRRVMPKNHPFRFKYGGAGSKPRDITLADSVQRETRMDSIEKKHGLKISHHFVGK